MGRSWSSVRFVWQPLLLLSVSMTSTGRRCINLVGRINSSIELKCEAKDYKTEWKKNSKSINYTSLVNLIKEGNSFNLYLKNLTLQDEGVYSCNFLEEILASYCLTIEAAPVMLIHSQKLPLEGIVWVRRGETVNLTCKAIGASPKVNISWIFNKEKSVPEHGRTTIEKNVNNSRFDTISTISQTVPADLRYIECFSEGQRFTNQSSSINVSVYDLYVIHNGSEVSKPIHITNNEILKMACRMLLDVTEHSVNLTWTLNGKPYGEATATVYQCTTKVCFYSTTIEINTYLTNVMNITCTGFAQPLPEDLSTSVLVNVEVNADNFTSPKRWFFLFLLMGGFLSMSVLFFWKRIKAITTSDPTSQDSRQVPEAGLTEDDDAKYTFISNTIGKDVISDKVLDSGQSEGITETRMNNTLQRKDVIIKSTLPGDSFLKYSTAYRLEAGKQRHVIARSIKDDSLVKDVYDFMKMTEEISVLPQHPNIVALLGLCKEEMPYYTYHEYVNGGSVRDHLLRNYQSSRLSRRFADHSYFKYLETDAALDLSSFANDVANGMDFLSTYKFCHPALSARKVLLSTDRICKLYDIWPFRLALQQITRLMNKKNPPTPWIAPETIFIEQYNDKSDVWSFGMFLWELYSFGEIPYKGMTEEEIEQELRGNQHLKLPRDCPGAISSIILSSWNKDQGRRPSFTQMRHELQSLRHYSLKVRPDLPKKTSKQQNGNESYKGGDHHTYFVLNTE